MWRYFLRMALVVVSIATSQMEAAAESCMLLCDQVEFPGPKNSPYSVIQCEPKHICMQRLNYTTQLVNRKRKNTIRFLHRYCADPRACIAHCRSTVVNDEPIVSCVSCMNATFEYEGKKIAEKICSDGNKPANEQHYDYDYQTQPPGEELIPLEPEPLEEPLNNPRSEEELTDIETLHTENPETKRETESLEWD